MSDYKSSKKELEKLKKKLTYEPKLVWDAASKADKTTIFKFADHYKKFLDTAKTEREAVLSIQDMAMGNGFSDNASSDPSTPFVKVHKNKSIALVRPGSDYGKGIRLIISHIDAPRLDLKQKPLYEDSDLAFLKTHYYGGIKKFQWLSRPLAMHGRILKSNGTILDINVGEKESDPVFTILDLLPHLSRKAQYTKKINEAIEGEKLNLIIGSLPLGDEETKDRFKLAALDYLNKTYDLIEEDFISAELEVVPAGKARDVGWDRTLIGGYGQDDRASAFTSLMAMLDMNAGSVPAVAVFVDKEEIGSDGSTGAKSKFLESVIGDLLIKAGKSPSLLEINRILACSKALSADVNAALDPDYKEVHEIRNAARMGYGVCITKFTGHEGKIGANDADAEYLGWLRTILNKTKVIWQTGELGKVDEGGGGTVAKFLAKYGMEIVDFGPPVLSMHSPFEITHKGDIYMTYKGFRSFLEAPFEKY